MGETLASLFNKSDVIEDCRQPVHKNLSLVNPYRLSVEINFRDGSKRYFRCKNFDRNYALSEVLTLIKSIETKTGEKVYWRFKGEEIYHIGSDKPIQYSKVSKLKTMFLEFFGLVE
ncbi:DUF6018 family natural product bioysynthesis protein [Metabacillus halosaccharovorans]|uniref:DUF6018 family natural product bioysynthesis protein n=1 Tax=Metabacillus halosaccharovorans TaxID=930124 RepID=UPI000C7F8226|nr:DUF6018 family natural product bioysynthesis protein [Metabacillus halosaccharovorans]MBU7595875.1 hypothetical protein [Metabacillus halosaccharovorans]PMC36271.1 hypothetical protein CJ195_15795 [Bacillus sp. UMB0899]